MAAVLGRKVLLTAASLILVYAIENPDEIKAKFRKIIRRLKQMLGLEEAPVYVADERYEAVVNSLDEDDDDLAPFKCPISQEIMVDPVMTPYGHCYDRRNIEEWLYREEVDPLTRGPLTREQLKPCLPLKHALEKFAKINRRLAEQEADRPHQE